MIAPLTDAEREKALELTRYWAEYEPGSLSKQHNAAFAVTVHDIRVLSRALLDAHERLAALTIAERERYEALIAASDGRRHEPGLG